MQRSTPFSIYNASAGSGKTFSLVKSYIKKIVTSNRPDYFKNILAITFTNKAVGEMKERIMESLIDFSKDTVSEKSRPLFDLVCEETKLEPAEIQKRAKKAVHFILHNYSSFDIETIDRFNHRLIRTFARDLKIASNFEVELDIDLLMSEAIDRVILKVGVDKQLTDLILDFSFEKVDEDRSWDITQDLKKISKILYNENDLLHVGKLKTKSISDFLELKSTLFKKKQLIENELKNLAQVFLNLLTENELQFSDFYKYIPSYFEKIAAKNFDVLTNSAWQNSFGEKSLYPKRVSGNVAEIIDALTPKFVQLFESSKALIYNLDLIETLLKNINSISLINAIYKEYLSLQEEKNILPISEFNAKIHQEIKEQPAPFIYERLGERYQHFYIDEFQDTSRLQWENLIPLVENALSQNQEVNSPGTLLLVGDAKQSIYRWRGGEPEQFISLYDHFNPFPSAEKQVQTLNTNYRSYDQIIKFNNAFFSFVSSFFSSEQHRNLYLIGNDQNVNKHQGGYVSISFVEATNKEEGLVAYPERVLEIVTEQIKKGYTLKDLCVLVRKNSQAVAIAEHLASNHIDVVSSEALLLKNAPEIGFIINLLKIIENFEDKKAKANALYFLHSHLNVKADKHAFIIEMLDKSKISLKKSLRAKGLDFDFETPSAISLYEFCEKICRVFFLAKNRAAYIQSFLELVFEFSQTENSSIPEFLEFWETKKTKSSIDLSDELNSVNIMTIHKAKGLEFPVVIYPFADDDLYDFKMDKLWFPLDEKNFSGFSEMLISVKNDLKNYGETGNTLFEAHKAKSELDTINIVYVAMTRAVEQLFIVSSLKNAENEKNTSSLFCAYLKTKNIWENTKLHYEFGTPAKPLATEKKLAAKKQVNSKQFTDVEHKPTNIKIATHNPLFWDSEKENPQEKGDLLHYLLAKIKSKNDIETVLNLSINDGVLSTKQVGLLRALLEKIVTHNQLKKYFEEGVNVKNEIEIFTLNGQSLRPDRINFTENNKVTIIDYKTGIESPKHNNQIINYGGVLNQMGFEINELLLIYIKQEIEVVKVEAAL